MDPASVAEDGAGYVVLSPGEVRETRPDVILTHGPIPMPEFGSACRIRFGPEVAGPVAMVQGWFAAHGRARFVWLVGPGTPPPAPGPGPRPTPPPRAAPRPPRRGA